MKPEHSNDPGLTRASSTDAGRDNLDNLVGYINHLVEDWNSWIASNNLNVIERYIKGEIEIVFRFVPVEEHTEYHFILRTVPFQNRYSCWAGTANAHFMEIRPCDDMADRNDEAVLIDVAGPVQRPKKVIPSFVGLERPYERKDIFGNMLTSPANVLLKFSGVVGEREVGLCRVFSPTHNCGGVTGIVKGGSQIADSVPNRVLDRVWDGGREPHLVEGRPFLSWVRLYNNGIWFGLSKSSELSIQVLSVALCPRDPPSSVVEQFVHAYEP